MGRVRIKLGMVFIILIFILIGALYLNYQNTALQISRYAVKDTKIPAGFDGYKIIQISDFHNTHLNSLTDKLVEEINGENPDIIVITGDLIDSRRTDAELSLNLVRRIADIAPIYYVTGNHESRVTEEYSKLKEGLLELGVMILDNKKVLLERKGDAIEIIGVNDPTFSDSAQYIGEAATIADELSALAESQDYYKILLSHRPELFEIYVEAEVNLVFTGHAHGGQIRLPFIGGLAAPNQGLLPKYTSGVYESEDTRMAVSRGIGNSIFPFRINNRPELVIAELRSYST